MSAQNSPKADKDDNPFKSLISVLEESQKGWDVRDNLAAAVTTFYMAVSSWPRELEEIDEIENLVDKALVFAQEFVDFDKRVGHPDDVDTPARKILADLQRLKVISKEDRQRAIRTLKQAT